MFVLLSPEHKEALNALIFDNSLGGNKLFVAFIQIRCFV